MKILNLPKKQQSSTQKILKNIAVKDLDNSLELRRRGDR